MEEQKRPLDPTRRQLRVFGVKVTDYEDRTAAILERAAEPATDAAELLRLSLEAIELTADLNTQLREMTAHVLENQSRALLDLRQAIQKASGELSSR